MTTILVIIILIVLSPLLLALLPFALEFLMPVIVCGGALLFVGLIFMTAFGTLLGGMHR